MAAFLTWFPRILSLAYVLFIASLALDSFAEPGDFWRHLSIFSLHLIPALFTALFLFIAWRWRILGGVLHIMLGMVFTIFFGSWRDTLSFILITLPLAVAGLFFILSKWNLPTGNQAIHP